MKQIYLVESKTDDHYDVHFNNSLLSVTERNIFRIEQLHKNHMIPIGAYDKSSGEVTSFQLNTWPSYIPTYTVVGQGPYEGDYYLTFIAEIDNVAMKIGRDGNLKYYN